MNIPYFTESMLLGIQHSFEPDHLAAVSVLSGENGTEKKPVLGILWHASQWALGHSFALVFFSILALVVKLAFSVKLSLVTEKMVIGPLMLFLGISAFVRIWKNKQGNNTQHVLAGQNKNIRQQTVKSFWVGMIHGLAGTGAAVSVALTLAAQDAYGALWVIMVQCLGIIVAMALYSMLMVYAFAWFEKKSYGIINLLNLAVGFFATAIGLAYIRNLIV